MATFTDSETPITGGKVGYGYNSSNKYTGFVSSSWTDAYTPADAPSGYTGYYIWNRTGGPAFTGGDGTWSTTAARWANTGNSGSSVNWENGRSALFHATSGGTATVGGSVTFGRIVFATNGYTVAGTGTYTFRPNNSGDSLIAVTGTNTATISAVISDGGNGSTNRRHVVKDSSGTLTLSGNNTYNGMTTVRGGVLIAKGVVALGAPGDTGAAAGSGSRIAINSGATLEIEATGTEILYKTIEGNGTLKKSGTGELVLNRPSLVNTPKTVGTLNVTAGTLTVSENAALTVNTSFAISGSTTKLMVGLGKTLGSPATSLTLAGVLDIVGTLPTAGQTYTLFGGTRVPSGTFATVMVSGSALTRSGSTQKWTNAAGDTISMIYTAGVKYEFIPKGQAVTTYTLQVGRAPTAGGSVSVKVGAGAAQTNPASQSVASGTSVTVTAVPGSGYTFVNWTAATGTTLPPGVTATSPAEITFTIGGNVNITANFEAVSATTYTLTVTRTDGGTTVPAASQTGIAAGTPVNISADAAPTHDFVRWAVEEGTATIADDTSPATTVTLSSNATVKATFTLKGVDPPPTYKLTVVASPPEGGTVSPSGETERDSGSVVPLTAAAAGGWTFDGWYLGEIRFAQTPTASIAMTEPREVTAKFSEIVVQPGVTYSLTLKVSPPGAEAVVVFTKPSCSGTGCNDDGSYDAGDIVKVVAKSNSGTYKFSHWDGDHSGEEDTAAIRILQRDMTVTAVFVESDLEKALNIDSARYAGDSSMSFIVGVSLAEGFVAGASDYYSFKLLRGATEAADTTVKVSGRSQTFNIRVEDMRFDTIYTLRVYIADNAGAARSSEEVEIIEVGGFAVQKVRGVGPSGDSVAYADNGRFLLDTERWKTTQIKDRVIDVLVKDVPGLDSVDGFIRLSKDYTYAVADFRGGVPGQFNAAFVVGIQVDAERLPSGYVAGEARLYRSVNGVWEVLFDSDTATYDGNLYVTGKGADYIGNDAENVYRLMINTKTPEIKIGNVVYGDGSSRKSGYFKSWAGTALGPVFIGTETGDITNDIEISGISLGANVSNARAKVVYLEANIRVGDAFRVADSGLGMTGVTIRAGDLDKGKAASGILVYLIVDNGSVSDTVNMSRNVTLKNYTTDTRDYSKRWSPLFAKVDLADSSIEKVFKAKMFSADELEGVGTDSLPLDNMRYRLFRYSPKVSEADRNGWVEYRSDTKKYFSMVNGRLMWLRTGMNVNNFEFRGVGSGIMATTVSLTDTFTVRDTLKSRQWTDLVVPFDFKVKVRDILAATIGAEKSDSLYFYKWEQDAKDKNQIFSAKRLYVWDTDDADTALDGPFTVYNNTGRNIMLRIPPKPAFLSPSAGGSGQAKSLAKMSAGPGFWYYAINAATDDVSNLASLRLGYYDRERIAPAPPTLGSRSVVLLSDDGWEIGDYLTPELSKSGRTFKLRFFNGERRAAVFKFSAEASAGVPERMQLMFVNAETGAIIGGSSSERKITVAANSQSDVYVVVGSRDYLNKTAVGPTGAKFAVGGVSVNQAARSVRIKYYVPLAGTDRVEVSVYNLKGRLVWKNSEKVRQSSWNSMEWKSRESRGGAAAAGLYIMRVRAVNVNGKTMALESRRVTFAR